MFAILHLATTLAQLRFYELKTERLVDVLFGSSRKNFAVAVEPIRFKAQSLLLSHSTELL